MCMRPAGNHREANGAEANKPLSRYRVRPRCILTAGCAEISKDDRPWIKGVSNPDERSGHSPLSWR